MKYIMINYIARIEDSKMDITIISVIAELNTQN